MKDGHRVLKRDIITDDLDAIVACLKAWILDSEIDAIITTGGTGVTGRDTTPEALAAVWDKEIPGFGELFRWLSFESIGTSTIQSRATGGCRTRDVYLCLAGLQRSLSRWLGKDSEVPIRQSASAVQLGGVDAQITRALRRGRDTTPEALKRNCGRGLTRRGGSDKGIALFESHDLESVFRNNKRMFKLGREAAIYSHCGPVVFEYHRTPVSLVDHRLNREGHPWLEAWPSSPTSVVRNLRVNVEFSSDAMADEVSNDAIAK